MPFVAVLNQSSLDDAKLDRACLAVDLQMRRDVAPLWGGYMPVMFFSTPHDLPVAADIARIMTVADTLDVDGAAGYHEFVGVPRGTVLARSDTTAILSHECIEMAVDPQCNLWVPMPDGRSVAKEACDPVEGDTYPIEITSFGQKLPEPEYVSNFAFPNWFRADSKERVDWCGTAPGPLQLAPNGYMIVRDKDGSTHDVWAKSDGVTLLNRARKVLNSSSRTYRRGIRL